MKKMIIKGVGTFMAKRRSDDGSGKEVVTLGSLQDLKIDLNVEIEDIFGGDGLFAIDTIVKNKSIEISATDAKFDLNTIQLLMGSTVEEDVSDYIWVLNEYQTAAAGENGLDTDVGVIDLEFADTLFTSPAITIRKVGSNELLEEVTFTEGSAPSSGEYMLDTDTGKVYVIDTDAGADFIINYKRTETVDKVDLIGDEVPFDVHVIHHGSFLQKDGSYAGLETELFACRAQGSYSIDAARATASASTVSLKLVDPERPDGKLGTIKRYNSATRV